MNEQDILSLIEGDKWMMNILGVAEKLNLLDWAIGAGFVRNKVWDHLHGFSNQRIDTSDIDLVYYDPKGNDQRADEKLSQKLKKQTGIEWEVVNQVYAHKWNDLPPYKSTEDALSKWPETATGTGVTIKDGELKLVAPHGIDDLVNLIIRPSPAFSNKVERVKERAEKKQWFKKWPKLSFVKD